MLDRNEWKAVAKLIYAEKEKFGLGDQRIQDPRSIEYFSDDVFHQVDMNKNGLISIEEFIEFFRSMANGTFTFKSSFHQWEWMCEDIRSFSVSKNYDIPQEVLEKIFSPLNILELTKVSS